MKVKGKVAKEEDHERRRREEMETNMTGNKSGLEEEGRKKELRKEK